MLARIPAETKCLQAQPIGLTNAVNYRGNRAFSTFAKSSNRKARGRAFGLPCRASSNLSEPALVESQQQPEAASSTFDWKSVWYPVAFSYDIQEPYPFTLLNTPIVIWKDTDGKFRCFLDACPHRLVPLSQGRIAPNGNLECPYHGWQFNGSGSCTSIPQGGDHQNPRACATAYQCIEKQGMVFVKLQPFKQDVDEAKLGADIPTLAELDDPDWTETVPMWRDLPMDYTTLIENVVDAAHVPFTHHASVSRRQSSSSFDDMRVTDKGPWGFTGTWETGPRKGTLGAQNTLFKGPNLMRHTIDAYDTKGFANVTAVFGVPISEGRSRVLVRQPFRFKNKIIKRLFTILPKFIGHLGNLNVLDDDNAFLHWQEREYVARGISEKPLGQVCYLPGPSDSYVAAFRRWINDTAGGGPFGPQTAAWLLKSGPRLGMDQLLDHYHSHTKNCTICKTALARIKVLQAASIAMALLGAVVAVAAGLVQWAGVTAPTSSQTSISSVGIAGVVVAAVAALIWRWCAKTIPRFFLGSYPPPRNVVAGEFSPQI